MARTTKEIQEEIITAVQSDSSLQPQLSSSSRTSLWRLWTYIVAFCFGTVERIYDALRVEINDNISRLKPHTLRWYAEKAKSFQYGFNLLADSDLFDNTGYNEQQIEASKIVAYAAVVEQVSASGRPVLRIKVAATNGVDLTPLTAPQLSALREYFKRIKDAGVVLLIDSLPADKLKQSWRIYYDPLIITAEGNRVDGLENKPAESAIKNYLKNLPFNGTFVNTYHIDAVQKVEGVVNAVLDESYATYGELPFAAVSVEYDPDSGYLRFHNALDLTIQYIPRSAIQ
jgi:hypothetical protein